MTPPPFDSTAELHPTSSRASTDSRELRARQRALASRYLPDVWRTLRRMGVPAQRVDDAMQQVFLIAFSKFSDIRKESERAFLIGVAIRVARRELEALGRAHRFEEWQESHAAPTHEAGPDSLLERKQALELLDSFLLELPSDLREIFVLHEIEHCTMAQIAETLDMPSGTVASRLRRARERFEQLTRRWEART